MKTHELFLHVHPSSIVCLEMHHRANALPLVHEFEGAIDVVETHGVSDERVEWNLTGLIALHITR